MNYQTSVHPNKPRYPQATLPKQKELDLKERVSYLSEEKLALYVAHMDLIYSMFNDLQCPIVSNIIPGDASVGHMVLDHMGIGVNADTNCNID